MKNVLYVACCVAMMWGTIWGIFVPAFIWLAAAGIGIGAIALACDKEPEKNFQKTLDKPRRTCYNKGTKKGRKQDERKVAAQKRILKNLLTKSSVGVIIRP